VAAQPGYICDYFAANMEKCENSSYDWFFRNCCTSDTLQKILMR